MGQGFKLRHQDQADRGSAQLHHSHATCDPPPALATSPEMFSTNYLTQAGISEGLCT